MPPSMSRTVEYRFKMVDNVTGAATSATNATKKLDDTVKDSNKSLDNQALLFIKNITVLTAFREGINGIIQELNYLGVVQGKEYENLRKMASAMNLFVDTARMVRGLVGIFELLNQKQVALAVTETYRSILNSKGANIGLVAGASAAAGVVGGGLLGFAVGRSVGRKEVTVNQTNNFNGVSPSQSRETERAAINTWEGY